MNSIKHELNAEIKSDKNKFGSLLKVNWSSPFYAAYYKVKNLNKTRLQTKQKKNEKWFKKIIKNYSFKSGKWFVSNNGQKHYWPVSIVCIYISICIMHAYRTHPINLMKKRRIFFLSLFFNKCTQTIYSTWVYETIQTTERKKWHLNKLKSIKLVNFSILFYFYFIFYFD